MEAVIDEIVKRHPDQKIQVVCGFSGQKDHTSMIHCLASPKNVKHIYPVSSSHFKLIPIEVI
jgi:hypothetical protein